MIIKCLIRENPPMGPLFAEYEGEWPPPYGTLITTLTGAVRMSSGRTRGPEDWNTIITLPPPLPPIEEG